MLKRTQYFRAHTGLPPDLAIARATDRDASFCQFVVRDRARFEVTDAARDDRVPQELVERYGIAAYIGEPVKVAGHVIGSLCAIDLVTRTLSDRERSDLAALAEKVSARLEQLREEGPSPRALSSAVAPAFGELRNVLAALIPSARAARVCAADLAPVFRIVDQLRQTAQFAALAGLTQPLAAFTELEELLEVVDDGNRRLEHTVVALERLLVVGGRRAIVAEVLALSARLAHHHLKLCGGVSWEPIDPKLTIAAARSLAVSAIGTALGLLATAREHRPPGISGWARATEGEIVVGLWSEGLSSAVMTEVAADLTRLFDPSPVLSFGVTDGRSCIHLLRTLDGTS